MSLVRRSLGQYLGQSSVTVCLLLAVACSGSSHATFAGTSGTPVTAPTNVTGQSNTSGISAGAALQVPSGTPTPPK